MVRMSLNQAEICSSSAGTLPQFLSKHYFAFVDPALNFLLIATSMGAVLFSMLLALLFFSTSSMARRPVFILNFVSVLLGIAGAVVSVYREIRGLKFPDTPINPRVIIATGALNGVTPILVGGILLLRLHAVLKQTSWAKYALIMAFPILCKIGRLTNVIIYLHAYSRNTFSLVVSDTALGGAAVLFTTRLPAVRIEWFVQVFDDAYSSGIFLYQVYSQALLHGSTRTTSQKLKALFWVCASSFVFPFVLGIVQLSIYMSSARNYLLALYIEETNFYFTIIGVVFATAWAAESRWAAIRRGDAGYVVTVVDLAVPGRSSQDWERNTACDSPSRELSAEKFNV
ncbi:hypothetical protein BV25DRAFT_757465 [Artomyces pyxidatus]|uniref:Uncharacterized protein n=1 Tax=Artomyces pyxidatus TaxID=48021 RepID=A0ACB8SYZ1_9AGAM|nr:hypothetical protein BV25DRAFT_757465 [Artomyces pyxidatus]